MRNHRRGVFHRRIDGKRHGGWQRSLSVVVVGAASALLLAACGASGAQSAAQDIVAGIAAQNAGQYANATSYYQKALASQPTNAVALYNLGDVEQFQHLDAAAKTHYLAALAIDPNFISALYNLATLEASTSPVEAEALYKQVIALAPKDASAHFNLGYVFLSLGKKSAGLAQINKGIKLDPSLATRVGTTTTTINPNG